MLSTPRTLHPKSLLDVDEPPALAMTSQGALHSQPVHQLFEACAHEAPASIAARLGDAQLRYGELEARANRLAHQLLRSGVQPGSRVALCVQPSFDLLVGILAIFKVGGVYVPLDPTYPEALLAGMLEEAAPALVLCHASLRALLSPERFSQLALDSDAAVLAELPASPPRIALSSDAPAYILYTSGTTGRPKGVVASHENLAHYLRVARARFGFDAGDRFCSLARYTFSISLLELLSPLCVGASLRLVPREHVLDPERLGDVLDEATVIHAGPSLLGSLVRHLKASVGPPRRFSGVRHLSSGGDMVPPRLLRELAASFDRAELHVIYGATELSCMGCSYEVDRAALPAHNLVGKPFPDVRLHVCDEAGEPVPVGVTGEIWFSGLGVVPGYLDRPELTADKFVIRDGQRFYCTGDLGRLDADGNLEMLGRRDYQVQLRGMRVELPGIENVIVELGLAAQCAVLVKHLEPGDDQRLVAYVVAPSETSLPAFRRALAQRLPEVMLPQALVVLDALPLTRNGKLDRARLAELPWQTGPEGAPGATPRDPLEELLARAFARALGRAQVGIDEDFFDLGGHSLLAISVMQEVQARFGSTLSPGLLFEHPTVRGLAAEARRAPAFRPRPVLLSRSSDKPPLFMLLGVHLYRELARELERSEADCTSYAIYAQPELMARSHESATRSVEQLAREYLGVIRAAQPRGPYRLAGMSFGGIIAYEVAQQLLTLGEEVAFLGLIDAILPERSLRGRWRKLLQLRTLSRGEWRHLLRRKVAPLWAEPREAGSELERREREREAAYFRAALAYTRTIRPLACPALLIVAGQRLVLEPLQSKSCGLGPHIAELHVNVLDADHLGLLEAPAVTQLARSFGQRLGGAPLPRPTGSKKAPEISHVSR